MQQRQFINNFNQLNMFWAIVSPILRSSRVCVFFYTLWCSWGWAKLSPETCWADWNY